MLAGAGAALGPLAPPDSARRRSQINGCGVCLGAVVKARKDGETDQRLFTLSAWRDTPYFSDAERAALALTEAVQDECEPFRGRQRVQNHQERGTDRVGEHRFLLGIDTAGAVHG